MRKWWRSVSLFGMSVMLAGGLVACSARAPHNPAVARPTGPEYEVTPMPTVPPSTPTPLAEAKPLPTRPVANPKAGEAAKKGEPIGPIITFLGAARADGSLGEPASVDKNGMPTYQSISGSGFIIVVEAKPGISGLEVGRRLFAYVPNDPSVRPDLEIESSRPMGNGSPEVCDRRRPNIGGVPAIHPMSFKETQKVSDALNDFACRFETFIESESSCTMNKNGDYSFAKPDTTTQFCMMVAHAYNFPEGDTIVSVRLLDSEGNPGPVAQLRVRRTAPPKAAK